MRRIDRRIWLGAIVGGVLVLLTLFIAPNNPRTSGSTYNRAPDGYGAWYAYMQQQGIPVQRWQKSPDQLPGKQSGTSEGPITLLQIYPALQLAGVDRPWVRQGNTLVILGVRTPVTRAAFRSLQPSSAGLVRIDTRRRRQERTNPETPLLGDRFGAVVWQESVGKGRVIFASTPYLAANAYQDDAGNFEFLKQLVTQDQHPIWVDEYLHGYQDPEASQAETQRNWFLYLANTPLFPVLLQTIVLLAVLIWAANRRFGQPQPIATPPVNNSTAYIQALAGVLEKAESSEFVLATIGKEERQRIQKALMLGREAVTDQELIQSWVQKTGRSPAELQGVLKSIANPGRIKDQDLLTWLANLQIVRSHLP